MSRTRSRFAALLPACVLALTAAPLVGRTFAADVAPGEVTRTRVLLKTGVTLDVAQSGDADGTPVLFLHGLTDSWFSYTRVLERLPAGIRAIVPTQRGHGESDRPPCCYGMDDFAADAVALLDALGIERAVVVGHSMGSFAAQRVAIAHPERVMRLVLIGSGDTPRTEVTIELKGITDTLTDPIDAAFVRSFQESTAVLPLPPAFLDRVVDESLAVPARVWRDALAGLIAGGSAAELGRIRVPTLLVSGERDDIWNPDRQRALAHGLPDARLVQYAGVGHAPHWEEPERFVADLLRFMERGK